MQKGESTKLQVTKGWWTVIEAKPLQPVNETFCLLPIDGANCCYLERLNSGASAAQCKPVKKGRSGNGGSAASPTIKSAKIQRERGRKFTRLELHTSPSWGIIMIYRPLPNRRPISRRNLLFLRINSFFLI